MISQCQKRFIVRSFSFSGGVSRWRGFSFLGASHCREVLMSGVCHCREVLIGRSSSPSKGLDVGSAQVHLFLCMEAEQTGMH